METVGYLHVLLQLAVLLFVFTDALSPHTPPSEVDCFRLCMLNATCYRHWSPAIANRSRRYGSKYANMLNVEKKKSCLDHHGYKYVGTGFCLKYVGRKVTWTTARATCHVNGGSLVKIDSEEKHTFLKTAYNYTDYWLGGNDRSEEGKWVWTDGTLIQGYLAWINAEPDGGRNQNCMFFKYEGWFNGGCFDSRRPFLCEIPAV